MVFDHGRMMRARFASDRAGRGCRKATGLRGCRQRPTREGAFARLIGPGRDAMVEAMKTVSASKLSARVDRFLRWFFTASPDAVVAPPPAKPRSRTVARRKPSRLRPKHSGPVRVAVKAKQ